MFAPIKWLLKHSPGSKNSSWFLQLAIIKVLALDRIYRSQYDMEMNRFIFLIVFVFAVYGVSSAFPQGQGAVVHNISPFQARQMMLELTDFLLLDVRSVAEFNAGHIEGARLIPFTERASHIPELFPYRARVILVYCAGGVRSSRVSQELADAGFTRIYDFGGINSWPYEVVR